MRKFILAFAILPVIGLTACSDKEDQNGDDKSEKGKQHIEKVQVVASAFETGDLSKIDEVVAPDFVDHTDRGDMVGRDSLKAAITMMHKQDTTLKFNTIRAFGDDEYAAIWYKLTGTSDGTMGLPKGPFTMNTIDMVRFKDGKAVEHWSFLEMTEVMNMMKGMQQPPPPPVK